jgi:hypothetical protein
MHFQFVVAPPTAAIPGPPTVPAPDPQADLLRELLQVQREQLSYVRAGYEAQNNNTRWVNFLNRWREDYPQVGEACQKTMPTVERAFLELLDDVTSRLADDDENPMADEFGVGEFLDRYGMKLSQLGTMINILGPIADASRTLGEQQQQQ